MLRFVGQRVLLAIFPFHEYGKCNGSWCYESVCIELKTCCRLEIWYNLMQSSAVHGMPAETSQQTDRPTCPLHRELRFIYLQTDAVQCRSSSFLSLLGKQTTCCMDLWCSFFPMPRMLINVQNDCPPVSNIKCHSTEIISSQRPWHANKFLYYRDSLCVSIWKFL